MMKPSALGIVLLLGFCSLGTAAPPQKKPTPSPDNIEKSIHSYLIEKTEALRQPLQKDIWKRLEVERVLDNAVELLSEKASGSVRNNVEGVADGFLDVVEDFSDRLYDVHGRVDAYKVPDVTGALRSGKNNISMALKHVVDVLDHVLGREEDDEDDITERPPPKQSSPPIFTTTTTTKKPTTPTTQFPVTQLPVITTTQKKKKNKKNN